MVGGCGTVKDSEHYIYSPMTLGSWVQILAGSNRVEMWLRRDLNPQPSR